MNLSCWTLTTGEIGMRNQAEGLAQRLGFKDYTAQTVTAPDWLSLVPPGLMGQLSRFIRLNGQPLSTPFPSVAISCGRRSIPAMLALKQHSPTTKILHVQNSKNATRFFDAVVVPQHDGLTGDNVFSSFGAIHHLTIETINAAAPVFASVWDGLPRPWLGVLVGGKSPHNTFTEADAERLGKSLAAFQQQHGGSLLVTPSRRTGAAQTAALQRALMGTSHWLWTEQTANPYHALLALSDAVLVTSDSISMLTEAVTSEKPLYYYDMGIQKPRIVDFLSQLRTRGYYRIFDETVPLESWSYPPLDETGRIAAALRQKLF
jgi:mitochondrial fission protein ELM1